MPVRSKRVDLNGADEIVAICRRGPQRQTIPILDLLLTRQVDQTTAGLRSCGRLERV
jgi:hypothetical protein